MPFGYSDKEYATLDREQRTNALIADLAREVAELKCCLRDIANATDDQTMTEAKALQHIAAMCRARL